MNEKQSYEIIENITLKDNNGKDRNIAGALRNYAYNKLSPLNLNCTRNQYNKFLEILSNAEIEIENRRR